MTKSTPAPTPAPQTTTNGAVSIPIIALVLGVASLITFMWFLGIPAIVLGIIGLRKYKENRGFSMTGLITGIISTLLLVAAVMFFFIALILGLFHIDSMQSDSPFEHYDQPGSRYYDTPSYQGVHEDI